MAATQSKERILAGAKELFLARGYAATTVDAICEKAELTKAVFIILLIRRRIWASQFWIGTSAKRADAGKWPSRPNYGSGRKGLCLSETFGKMLARPLERRMSARFLCAGAC